MPITPSSIADIRTDYKQRSLSENEVEAHPLAQFEKWWQEALQSNIDEVNAMTLSTVSADGWPDGRIVLLKGLDQQGFTFFTNYLSAKGQQMLANPRASLVFFWKELERQVRIKGAIEKTDPAESDAYFAGRPPGSKIGAWTSPQSQPIQSREWLELHEKQMREQFQGKEIGRPPHWGGYRLKPAAIEFWQGRPSRLHDRILYSMDPGKKWKIERLAP